MRFRRALVSLLLVLMTLLWHNAAPHAQAKTACDLIPIADIEAVVGRKIYLRPTRPQLPDNCNYSTADPFDNRPTQPVINIFVKFHHENTPDPEAYDNAARVLRQQRGVTVDPMQGLGDAAFGFGNELAGDVYVFRGGVDTLEISGTMPVERLKPLALKALDGLGGPARTGYAYGGTRPGAPPAATVTAAAATVVGGGSFSQAVYITQSEFLKEVKDVSLEIHNDVKAVPDTNVRGYLTRAFAARGITVRAGAPVTVIAGFQELPPTPGASSQIHNILATLEFYTRVVVMRSGKAHLVMAAPARSFTTHEYTEAGGAYKFVFGDTTFRDFNALLTAEIEINLDDIDANNVIDDVPWAVKTWSAAQTSAADSDFLRLMNSGRVEEDVTEGIDTAPRLELVQPTADDPQQACPAPANWRVLWNDIFRSTGWTASQRQADLTVRHTFYCVWELSGPVADDIALRESNAVFVLNGRVFRKPVTLLTLQNLSRLGRADGAPEIAMYMQARVAEFDKFELGLGASDAKGLPPAPLRIAAGAASPDNPAARIGPHRMDSWERTWEAPFVPVAQYTPAQARRGRMILQGTVSRVALEGNSPQRLRIFFKESPDNSAAVCTPSPDIFSEFGTGFRGLIGRTLEVAGDMQGCGIFVAQSNQFRVIRTDTNVP